jgi:hypothetical protein
MSSLDFRRGGRTLLPILIAVFVVLAIAAGAVWLLTGGPDRPSVDEGRGVADAFLAAVRAGRADQAWETATTEFKSAEGRESFRRYVVTHPALKTPTEFISAHTVDLEGQPREEYVYRAPQFGDGKTTVRLLIARESGAWKVDRLVAE